MKDKIIFQIKKFWPQILGVVLALACISLFFWYQNSAHMPTVESNGDVNGTYSIADIALLKQPYLCIFEKNDENSKIEGGIFINNGDVYYGEFDITTGTSTEAKTFGGYVLVRDGKAYSWTSLANVGSISKAAKSAIHGKSVAEQIQIVGKNDRLEYKCRWQKNGINDSFFAIPDWITFSESKN